MTSLHSFDEVNTIDSFVEIIGKKFGDKIAFTYVSETLTKEITYSEFARNIAEIVAIFLKNGIVGQRILLIDRNSYGWIVANFAAIISGNILIPWNDKELDTVNAIMEECAVDYIFCRQDINFFGLDYKDSSIIGCSVPNDGFFQIIEVKHKQNSIDLPKECAYIFFTSGSTGTPKGVLHSQKNIIQAAYSVSHCINLHESTLLFLPLNHIYAYCDVLILGLICGTHIYISDGIGSLSKECIRYSPGCVFMVPALLYSMYDLLDHKFHGCVQKVFGKNIRTLFVGGAALNPEYVKKYSQYGIEILNGYGMTETCGCVCLMPSRHIIADSVGVPVKKIQVKIEHEVVYLFTPFLMLGYLENGHIQPVSGHWFKTNDYGLYADGYLYLGNNRENILVLPNGKKVSKSLYAEIISQIPGIQSVDAFIQNDKLTVSVLYNSKKRSSQLIREDIISANRNLPFYKKIQHIEMLEANSD